MALSTGIEQIARRVLPPRVFKHYVRPALLGRPQVAYDARQYFESWHRATFTNGANDAGTIAPGFDPLWTAYHYNAVENAILQHWAAAQRRAAERVLDVGSGAGHWIDFYRRVLGASEAVGVDLSSGSVQLLADKYAADPQVSVLQADVSAGDFSLPGKFDVVNCIGVMFHIVDDALWQQAVANLGQLLSPGGVMVVGGQFGWLTRNVQFHNVDEFTTWEQQREADAKVARVNKRIRSLRMWRRAAQASGMHVAGLIRTPQHRQICTPENNVLVLEKISKKSPLT